MYFKKQQLQSYIDITPQYVSSILETNDPILIRCLIYNITTKTNIKNPDRAEWLPYLKQAQNYYNSLPPIGELTDAQVDQIIERGNKLELDGLQYYAHDRVEVFQKSPKAESQSKAEKYLSYRQRALARKTDLYKVPEMTNEFVRSILQGDNVLKIYGVQSLLSARAKNRESMSAEQKEAHDANIQLCKERINELTDAIDVSPENQKEILARKDPLEIDGLYKALQARKVRFQVTKNTTAEADINIQVAMCLEVRNQIIITDYIKFAEQAIISNNRYEIESCISARNGLRVIIQHMRERGSISVESQAIIDQFEKTSSKLSQARVTAQYAAFERSGYEDRQEARRILQEEFDAYKKSVADGHIDANSEEARWMEDAYKEFEKNKAGNPGVKITRVRLDHLNHRLVTDLQDGVKTNNSKAIDNTLTRMTAEYEKLQKAVDASYKVKTEPPTKGTKLPPAPRSGKSGSGTTSPAPAPTGAATAEPAYIFDGRLITPDALQELNAMLDNSQLTDLQKFRLEKLIQTIEAIQAKISEMLAIPYEKPTRENPTPATPPIGDDKPLPPAADPDAKKDIVRPVITREQLAQKVTESLFKLKNFKWMSPSEITAIRQLIMDIHLVAKAKMVITSNGDVLEKVTITTTDQAQKTAVQDLLRNARKQGSSDAFRGIITIFGNNIVTIKVPPSVAPNEVAVSNDPVDALKAQIADLDAESAKKYKAAEQAADVGDEDGFNRLLAEAEIAKNQADGLRVNLAALQQSKGSSPSSTPPV